MEEKIKEFVNSDGTLISSKIPNLDPKSTAKTTTDKSVKMRTQPYNWTIYNVKLQEKEMPYSEEANKMAENPENFYKFLESVGNVDKFEEYFEISDPKERLKEVSRLKAYEMMETIFNKRSISTDVITRTQPTIDEIKNKEVLLLDKLTRIADTIKEIMSEDEKKVILSYFSEKIR
jgi:hypothetical protein